MKKIISIASVLCLALVMYAFSNGEESYETLKIGQNAPMIDHEMEATDGEVVNLESLSSANGLLVIFSCNTCPFVVAWEDRYPEIAELAAESEVGFALVNSNKAKREGEDSMDEMIEHASENGYGEVPYLVDTGSQVANAFGAKTTPHVFLFDSEMKLVYEGAIDDNHKSAEAAKVHYLKNALKHLEMGKAISPNNTKAVGCSIKRVKS